MQVQSAKVADEAYNRFPFIKTKQPNNRIPTELVFSSSSRLTVYLTEAEALDLR